MHTMTCWACRDARAACNRAKPRCSRCVKLGASCQYGMRLSWPKAANTKRSLTHSIRGGFTAAKRVSQTSFVNATAGDVQLHHYLRMRQGLGSNEVFVFERFGPLMSPSWLPVSLGYEERELLDYFICTATSMLAIFEPDQSELLSLLVRLALFDDSPPSLAVLQSALALSSLHRHGLQGQASRFKARALRAMIASCTHRTAMVQHAAANMLLCHLEMSGMPNTMSFWFCHLLSAKSLVDNLNMDSQYLQSEFVHLVDWVWYHMVLSQFSIRHWYKVEEEPIKGIKTSAPGDQGTCQSQKLKKISSGSHEFLGHLHNMLEIIRSPTQALYHDNDYEKSLRCLERKITNSSPPASEGVFTTWGATTELFQLAALIYLRRASHSFSVASPEVEAMLKRAYILLDSLKTFNFAFPLLIFGCEAETDEQRMKILELMENTMETSSLNSLHVLKDMLQRIWVQDDLAVDYKLDLSARLDAVITCYHIMPSFA